MNRVDLPEGARAKANWHDISRPDWLIIGAPLPDGTGVALLASSKLTNAQLQQLATDTVYIEQITAGWAKTGTFLNLDVGLEDFVVAAGATYPEALEALFRIWTPPNRRPPADAAAIDAELTALEGELTEPTLAIEASPHKGGTMITAKVKLSTKSDNGNGTHRLVFVPDYQDGRNKEWALATPGLLVDMGVIDSVAERFEPQGAYTLTFTPSQDDDPDAPWHHNDPRVYRNPANAPD